MKTIKRLGIILSLFFVSVSLFTACENDAGGDCKYCKIVKRDAQGVIVEEGVEAEYCLDELDDKINAPGTTDPEGNTTRWECN